MVMINFEEGKCLFSLGRYQESISKFEYVIANGNNLRVCELSKKMISNIKGGKI